MDSVEKIIAILRKHQKDGVAYGVSYNGIFKECADSLEALMREPVAYKKITSHQDEIVSLSSRKYEDIIEVIPLFALPPDTQAIIDKATERAAKVCDKERMGEQIEDFDNRWSSVQALEFAAMKIRALIGSPLEERD